MDLSSGGTVAVTAKEQAQWMLHQLVPGRGVCNLGIALLAERHLRWWPLRQALNHLLFRHPALRAVVRADGTALRKQILPPDRDFPLGTEAATEDTLEAVLTALAARPFDLDVVPLARAHLVLLPRASVACLVFHHLVADYTSAAVLLRELARLYDGYAGAGQPPADLAGAGPIHVEPPAAKSTLDYWVAHLDGVDPAALALAGARPIDGRPTFAGARLGHRLSVAALAAVGRIQQRTRLTQNMVLLAGYYLLLYRHGAGPDIVVGIPVDGRHEAPGEVVGFHANTLPIRVRVDGSDPAELLRRTRRAFLAGLEHGTVSFEAIQAALPHRSGDWRAPLFRHMFNYRPVSGAGLRVGGAPVTFFEVRHSMSRLDLEWVVAGSPAGIEVTAAYSTEVHDAAFVAALLERYDAILVDLAAALDAGTDSVRGWSAADAAAVDRLNGTARGFPGRGVPAEIRARSAEYPDAPAVRHRGRTTSYRDLMWTAEAVRVALLAHGVGRGDTVALHAARRPELAAAVLGVWAAGAAYLPLDPRHPARRLADQLDDAGAALLLADAAPDPLVRADRRLLRLDRIGPPASRAGDPPMAGWAVPDPDDIAYVIYTSGSTGRPKGVEVSHANLTNVLLDFADRLAATRADATLWLTTFSFDISALELLLPLVTGGRLVIADDPDQLQPDRLLDLVYREDVGIVQATPTTWRHVGGDLRGRLRGRRVLCGGEPLTAALADRLLADGCRLFNVYGPTETTIWSTAAELTAPVREPVPIGWPIANTTAHVLGPDRQSVPPGVPGELYLAGAGVAAGYRGHPERTAQRYPEIPGIGRCYRTGDQVRQTGAGLVFLGRLDRQVKVRGHRVELTEVEAVLAAYPGIRAAAVITEPDGAGETRLVAVVQPAAGAAHPTPEQLHAEAAARLPDAAVPSRYVLVPELPVTGNHKTDHRALAALAADDEPAGELPADPLLRLLVELWREVLGDARLGADDNFFVRGGHSLLAVSLAQRVAAAVGVPVEFDVVFDAPTPRRLRNRLPVAAAAPP
jgi:amino acid adenylation domain-containing protein